VGTDWYGPVVGVSNEAELDALIAEATVDCYGDDEQSLGLYTAVVENLSLPFETVVLGVSVTVEDLDLTSRGDIVARCSRDRSRQVISLLDLPLPTPPPAGVRWIEAYRRWAG
jgi:hypothetical protein